MDIFDRLGNLIRTILDDSDEHHAAGTAGASRGDPDMRRAWEELEEYMKEDRTATRPASGTPSGTSLAVPEYLRKDFRNLEVPFGAPLEEVRRAYKRLMATFHPDRHSADPDRFRTATEVTKKLNQSFQRIRSHYEINRQVPGAT